MKKILFIFISISSLFLASSLFSQQLSNQDALELLSDREWSIESQTLGRLAQDAIGVIQYQNQQQQEINNLVNLYFESEQMTVDELWEGLDYILNQTDIYSENLNEQVDNLKINTSSSNPNARKIYKEFLSLIYDMNDYSIENNKLTKDLIGEKVEITEVNLPNQESTLKTLLELVLLGDLVSLNLAAKLTVDPNNIDAIEKLKKLLGE